jgi:hypothetical protein
MSSIPHAKVCRGLLVAIDPGLAKTSCGSTTFFSATHTVVVPNRHQKQIMQMLSNCPEGTRVFIELITGARGGGGTLSPKLTVNYGWFLGLLDLLELRYMRVAPVSWQNGMDCRTGGNKSISRAKATKLFGDFMPKITNDCADSMLIAEFGRRVLHGECEVPAWKREWNGAWV